MEPLDTKFGSCLDNSCFGLYDGFAWIVAKDPWVDDVTNGAFLNYLKSFRVWFGLSPVLKIVTLDKVDFGGTLFMSLEKPPLGCHELVVMQSRN
jgi:hypothetical protein